MGETSTVTSVELLVMLITEIKASFVKEVDTAGFSIILPYTFTGKHRILIERITVIKIILFIAWRL